MLLQPDSMIHHPWSERCLPIPPGWLLQHSVHSGEIWWWFSPASFFFSLLHPFLLPFYSSPHLSVSLFRRGPPPKKNKLYSFCLCQQRRKWQGNPKMDDVAWSTTSVLWLQMCYCSQVPVSVAVFQREKRCRRGRKGRASEAPRACFSWVFLTFRSLVSLTGY